LESGDALEALMHDVRVWVQEGETEKLVAEEAKARERLGHVVNSRGIKRYLKREWAPLGARIASIPMSRPCCSGPPSKDRTIMPRQLVGLRKA
jgi:hypothetical protein